MATDALVQASSQWRDAPVQRAITAPVFRLGAAALRHVWEQLGLPLVMLYLI